ncbi:hypothetical protein AB1N83_001059 [Pleurotus pulmonarius]
MYVSASLFQPRLTEIYIPHAANRNLSGGGLRRWCDPIMSQYPHRFFDCKASTFPNATQGHASLEGSMKHRLVRRTSGQEVYVGA